MLMKLTEFTFINVTEELKRYARRFIAHLYSFKQHLIFTGHCFTKLYFIFRIT